MARRDTTWEESRLSLQAARQPRWLRFHWKDENASPVTIPVPPSMEAGELRLPPRSAGGEIVAAVDETLAIRPIALLLDGRRRIESIAPGAFGAAGVTPGEHT